MPKRLLTTTHSFSGAKAREPGKAEKTCTEQSPRSVQWASATDELPSKVGVSPPNTRTAPPGGTVVPAGKVKRGDPKPALEVAMVASPMSRQRLVTFTSSMSSSSTALRVPSQLASPVAP